VLKVKMDLAFLLDFFPPSPCSRGTHAYRECGAGGGMSYFRREREISKTSGPFLRIHHMLSFFLLVYPFCFFPWK